MNRALLTKTIHEAKWLLVASSLALFAFHWLRVWLISQLKISHMRRIFNFLPDEWTDILPVPVEQIATSAGRIALSYDDPFVLVIVSVWAISRGSDAVSGEIGRGTMELLLAQPIRRLNVLLTHAVITTLGACMLASSAWLGTWAGLATVTLEDPVDPMVFSSAAVNLFALTFFLAGISTLLSSFDRYRWRTIGLIVGFYAFEMIVKMVGLMAPQLGWLRYGTFLTAFEPQLLVCAQLTGPWSQTTAPFWPTFLQYNMLLIGLALASYIASAYVFCRRDLPAPL